MCKTRNMQSGRKPAGFTFIELIVVMVILGIIAALVIPMMGTSTDMQAKSVANQLAADLDYAKSLAVMNHKPYTVVFDTAGESYQVEDETGAIVTHPVHQGNFIVDIDSDSRIDQVDLVSAVFSGSSGSDESSVTFDYLGAPYRGTDTTTAMNSGQVTLTAGSFTLTVDVEPMTGYVAINGP